MTLPASVPTVPEWQLCRVRWFIGGYGGTGVVGTTVAFSSPVERVSALASGKTLVREFPPAGSYVASRVSRGRRNPSADSYA